LAVTLFLAFSIIGAGLVLLLPRTYATSSEVLVKRPDTELQSTTYPQIDALLAWNRDTAMETYVALARQPVIAERVIRTLGLKLTPKDLLNKSVTVAPLTNSDIIVVTVDWRNASESATIANTFARFFIERQRSLAAAQASEAAGSLELALNKAQLDLSKAEEELTQFESRNALTDASTQTAGLLSAISDVQAKERAAEADRMQAKGQLARIGAQLKVLPSSVDASKVVSGSPVADQMEQQLAQEELQLRLLRRQFTPKYPDVVATEKQIAALSSALRAAPPTKVTSTNVELNPLSTSLASQSATLQAQIAGNTSQLVLLRSQEAALLRQLREFPRGVSELSILQRRAKAAEAIYDALQNNYFNAVVAKSMAVSDLYIVQYADPATATVRPPRLLSLLMVAFAAFLATLAIVVFLEYSPTTSASLSEVR
jgi:uncharacterized protein involved in exopolysaccharide biosynthesis